MFFPVRCVFWMTVVYTSITWPGGEAAGRGSGIAADLAGATVAQAAASLKTAATDACLAAPARCADKIAAVSRLAENIVPVPMTRPGRPAARSADTLRADDRLVTPVHTRHVSG